MTILVVLFSSNLFAQQGLQMEFTEQDSVQMELERGIEYRQMISGGLQSRLFMNEIKLPDFDYIQEYQKRYALTLDVLPVSGEVFTGLTTGYFGSWSPFYHNGTVLSQAAYQLGNKFVLGGYSYGANLIHTAPFPNQSPNTFDNYGSTMFIQYKVSKNFKIETRVSVGGQKGPVPGF